MQKSYVVVVYIFLILLLIVDCTSQRKSKSRAYDYGWYPKKFDEIKKQYDTYAHFSGCQSGETIASIGAGNGTNEIAISCFQDDINWYLEEIDPVKLYQFHHALSYFEQLRGKEVNSNFTLVLGTETTTNLQKNHFDRILMNNVYHELTDQKLLMEDISKLLKQNGHLVIMELMARKPGEQHANCGHMRLYEPEFLEEMKAFGFKLIKKEVGEKMSLLTYYTFII